MSDLVSDCERQKVRDNLRISSSAKKYRSLEDIDDSQIALSVEIPYYLLNEWLFQISKFAEERLFLVQHNLNDLCCFCQLTPSACSVEL